MSVSRTDATVVSADLPVAAWVYRPAGHGPHPVVVMAHGFGALRDMGLDPFARAFAEAGLLTVVFDHPNFGASGGTPRQEVNPGRQLRAFRDVITWAQGLEDADAERVGVWGTSFSGGHAVVLAASDDRVGAAVAQVPFLAAPLDEIPEDLVQILVLDEQGRSRGEDPIAIPITTDDPGGFGALSPDPAAHAWFTSSAAGVPGIRNEVTIASLARLFSYRPLERATEVHAPLLLIAASEDVLCPPEVIRAAAARVPVDHELLELPGGHFSVYGEHLAVASQAAAAWLARWLGAEQG